VTLWRDKQLRQLGDIGGDPPRLVFGEQIGCRSPAGLLLEIDVGGPLAVCVANEVARGLLLDRPFSICVHKNEFSFLNFILVVTAKRASISQGAMPTNGRRSRSKEYPHVT
jgi:hypothetical protein